MQSGLANTGFWLLEFEPETPLQIDSLMGYTSSSDMKRQIQLRFETQDEAIAYAKRNGIPFRIEENQPVERRRVSYSENFRYDRTIPWTH